MPICIKLSILYKIYFVLFKILYISYSLPNTFFWHPLMHNPQWYHLFIIHIFFAVLEGTIFPSSRIFT